MHSNLVYLVVTSHASLGATGHQTGLWYEELAAPYYVFEDAGFQPLIVSPRGGQPPIDPGSAGADFRTPSVERLASDDRAQLALDNTRRLDDLPGIPAAVFLVGGHGTMWDFPDSPELGRLLEDAFKQKIPMGAVCHGVAGLLSYRANGSYPLIRNQKLTGFSDQEETTVGLAEVVPFLLQQRLMEVGAAYSAGAPFSEHVVEDGLLVTGQNPPSSQKTAEALLRLAS